MNPLKQLIILIIVFSFFVSCSDADEIKRLQNLNKNLSKQVSELKPKAARLDILAQKLKGIKATIVTNLGSIDVEFYPEIAPLHVHTFITRAEAGFYNNTQFHRVMPDFMIQGGDPNSAKFPSNYSLHGQGGPVNMIPHEFNPRNHKRGILSTARVSDKSQGAGSQFFIMNADKPFLDNEYTVFGNTVKGLDVVDRITAVDKDGTHPKKPVIIETIKVYR